MISTVGIMKTMIMKETLVGILRTARSSIVIWSDLTVLESTCKASDMDVPYRSDCNTTSTK
ncbi:MAG: hypothetical protein NTZ22_06735, partial [Hyphomicrobiales bacterium]|nr:hypothetical protein [Hyphomicrobiales bacterium]